MPDILAPAAIADRALLVSVVRHGMVAAGFTPVTRGIINQGVVDGFVPTAMEKIAARLGSAYF